MNNWRSFLKEEKSFYLNIKRNHSLFENEESSNNLTNIGAFIYRDESNVKGVAIYEVEVLKNKIQEISDSDPNNLTMSFLSKIILNDVMRGIIEIRAPYEPCNKAWSVAYIAGPGYGDTLYKLAFAISPTHRLSPDRAMVKIGARKRWRKMYAAGLRNKIRFDDTYHEHPRGDDSHTEDESDDCRVHSSAHDAAGGYAADSDPNEPIDQLNYAYEALESDLTLFQELKNVSDQAISKIVKINKGFNEEAMIKSLEYLFKDNKLAFFKKHYRKDSK